MSQTNSIMTTVRPKTHNRASPEKTSTTIIEKEKHYLYTLFNNNIYLLYLPKGSINKVNPLRTVSVARAHDPRVCIIGQIHFFCHLSEGM